MDGSFGCGEAAKFLRAPLFPAHSYLRQARARGFRVAGACDEVRPRRGRPNPRGGENKRWAIRRAPAYGRRAWG